MSQSHAKKHIVYSYLNEKYLIKDTSKCRGATVNQIGNSLKSRLIGEILLVLNMIH